MTRHIFCRGRRFSCSAFLNFSSLAKKRVDFSLIFVLSGKTLFLLKKER